MCCKPVNWLIAVLISIGLVVARLGELPAAAQAKQDYTDTPFAPIPAVSDLRIALTTMGIELRWSDVGAGVTRYEVWRSDQTYFQPGDPGSVLLADNVAPVPSGEVVFADNASHARNAAINDAYLVRAVRGSQIGPISNRVGEFDYGLGDNAAPPTPTPVRAVRVDYNDYSSSRSEVAALEQNMRQANVNMAALGAGRLDWNYFKWQGHEYYWSSDVIETGIDFLAEDTARFGQFAHVDAVVDVYAPRYIQAHPEAAAISWLGQPSTLLVSTAQLVNGPFGQELLSMIEYIAANYAVDSVSITELLYYIEGYGNDDKALYTAYTGRTDWPRHPDGKINIDDPSIGEWRSYEIGRFLSQAAARVHPYGKQLYMDVDVSWGNLSLEAASKGQKYSVMLSAADRLVVWDYYGLSGYPPSYTADIANYLAKYGTDRIIISIGLWMDNGSVMSSSMLEQGMVAGLGSAIPNLWITPSRYFTAQHWQVMTNLWNPSAP